MSFFDLNFDYEEKVLIDYLDYLFIELNVGKSLLMWMV